MKQMKKIWKWLFMVFTLFFFGNCQSPDASAVELYSSPKVRRIDSLFCSQYDLANFYGGVVISQKGEIIYEKYLGLADRAWGIPIDENVRFDIASLNKSMIAALVLRSVEAKKLNLDDKLVDLLADYAFEGDFHPEITLHDMLSHSSGLPDYDSVEEELKANQFLRFKRLRFSNEAYVNFISKIAPVNEPQVQFYYSNFAYHLLVIILEETYEMPFAEILQNELAQPLGLINRLSVQTNEVLIPRLAKSYQYQESTKTWQLSPFIDLSLGRRVFSTALDLNKWAQVMDNPGYLSAESLNLMKDNHLKGISDGVSYGYGWVTVDSQNPSKMGDLDIDEPYIIHGGSTDGFKAMLININEGTYVISFLSNVGNRTRELALAQQIVNILKK